VKDAKSGPGWTESMKERKPFVETSSYNKNDQKDVGRGKPITYKRGGAVAGNDGHKNFSTPKRHPDRDEAPKAAKAITPHLPGGSGGGAARLKKQHSSAFHG
jgi:hypothetical protein